MDFKKNVWLIYIMLLLLGGGLLSFYNYYHWQNLNYRIKASTASLNHIYSTSVDSVFNQQEVTLKLLGQQLLKDKFFLNTSLAQESLDSIKQRDSIYLAFGLINIQGDLMVGSSNIKPENLPNLLKNELTRDSFQDALNSNHLSLGRTYFIDILNDYVLPIRKSIKDMNGNNLAVMTTGIRTSDLLEGFNGKNNMYSNQVTSALVQDKTFYRLVTAGDTTLTFNRDSLGTALTEKQITFHENSLLKQTGLNLDDLRHSNHSAEYIATSLSKKEIVISIRYLSKFKIWSLVASSTDTIKSEFQEGLIISTLIFLLFAGIVFWLFISLYRSQEKNRKRLLDQANHDFLTGLFNRLYLKYVEPIWVDGEHSSFYVVFIDLDNFKNINDSYGHNLGDQILKKVAERLIEAFGVDDLICRQGGDEFIVLCPDKTEDEMKSQIQKIFNEITQSYKVEQFDFSIGASIGISKFPDDGETFESLFSAADSAMYRAKRKSLSYLFYDNSYDDSINSTLIEQAMFAAIQNEEFYMVYQPQINYDGSIYGAEALVRWEHKDMGFVSPERFIKIAENTGQIFKLGDFILRQSIADAHKIVNNLSMPYFQLSINISVMQFLSDGFIEKVQDILSENNYPAEYLTLEITESIFIDDFEFILPLFNQIRSLGIKLSLDDFGTGFSSLSMLKRLPIDELKIDKSFIDPIVDFESDRIIVGNILNIAKGLNLKVIAEGIEDKAQVDILKEYSCDVQQGYYHSYPIKLGDFEQFVKDFN